MDQRSGDGYSLEKLKSSRTKAGKEFPNFSCGRENRFCSEQDHPEFLLQEEGQSRRAEGPRSGSVPERETNCLHDLRPLSSDWCS